jgi:hypothetical protein
MLILDILYNLLIIVGRLGLEPRTKALKGLQSSPATFDACYTGNRLCPDAQMRSQADTH